MASRPDHFPSLLPGEGPQEARLPIPADLVEKLERQFPPMVPNPAYTLDGAFMSLSRQAERVGQLQVIEFIRRLQES